MEFDKNSLITVYTSSFSHEIYLAKNKLELEGIESFVFDDNLTSTIGTAFIEEYKLKVRSKNFEETKTILSLHKI
ncbi:MAG: hypothetical protein L3J45_09845 [Flavobacteriaceae bacterium]|nr:hypothetical protein [Flavobacteriaceae bacterium]